MNRRMMAWLTAIAGTLFVVVIAVLWKTLFGPGTWGTGGNMVAWTLCGGLSFLWLNVVQKERHVQALTQARRLHDEKMAQADRHHQELKAQAQHHHEEMKAHVTSAVRQTAGE